MAYILLQTVSPRSAIVCKWSRRVCWSALEGEVGEEVFALETERLVEEIKRRWDLNVRIMPISCLIKCHLFLFCCLSFVISLWTIIYPFFVLWLRITSHDWLSSYLFNSCPCSYCFSGFLYTDCHFWWCNTNFLFVSLQLADW